ncbi:L,D-transpeptidase family protein [Cohnella endophytica]|nr:L,D-transpeptidase family protein [Cohnella endophytica]
MVLLVLLAMGLTAVPETTNALATGASAISVSYDVSSGETLYGISKKFYLTGDYEQVAKINGLNPKTALRAGTTVTLRNPAVLGQYAVQPGDTLYAITNRFFDRDWYLNILMAYNGIADPNTDLKAGMTLRVPIPAGERRHAVRKGETLYGLSATYFDIQDYRQAIAVFNDIQKTPDSIQAGKTLLIPNPYYGAPIGKTANEAKALSVRTLSIEIDLTLHRLSVLSNGTVTKRFDIASGKKKGLTPTGTFEIVTKIKNPWYSAKGIPGGDPTNPLGSRWLGLNVPNTQGTKYGIHGTNAPASIGTNASAGCIRMLNEDVDWLYDSVPTGTKVTIRA